MDQDHSTATYVDVGCNHPYEMSNTAFFYDRGWNGVTIDPNPEFEALYSELRPRDRFVNCGVAQTDGSLVYFQFKQSLFNTFDSKIAKSIAAFQSELISQTPVNVRPLKSILREIWPQGRSLRLLSIDCEGMDHEVLESHDFDQYPVEFICVEIASIRISECMAEATINYLRSLGFVAISKLCKSMVFIHESVIDKWGLNQ